MKRNLFVALSLVGALALAGCGQATGGFETRQMQSTASAQSDRTAECQQHLEETSSAVERLASSLETAAQSEDTTRASSAREEAKVSFQALRGKMEECSRLMQTLPQMSSGAGGMMSSGDMAQMCQSHHDRMVVDLDRMANAFAAGEQASDSAIARAEFNRAAQSLREMKADMDMCARMMRMMGHMGMMGR